MKFARIAAIVGASVGWTGSASAGPVACLVADPIWQAGHSAAETTLATAIDTMATTFATQSLLTNEALLSAIRVHTRQRSLSGEQTAVARTSHAEAAANVYVEQRSAERIREAHETYGPQGQMVGGCEMIADLQMVDDAMTSRALRASEVLSGDAIDAVPGSAVAPLEAAARRLSNDNVEAVSAVAFFDPNTSSADRDAYMNNIIGLPFLRPDGIDGAEDEIAFMQTRRWEAMRSPAIVSLAAVRAASEPGGHFDADDSAPETMSYIGALDWYIAQFGGGENYEQWSAALVSKSEVGLNKEIARLRAINLQLAQYRQESQDRQLAVIATLLAGIAVQ